MEICKARKQEPVSALVARIQAKARRFVAARSPRPSGASQRFRRSGKGQYKGVDGRVHEAGSMCPSECEEEEAHRTNERMIGCDKAEAAGGDLVDPLGVEAERKQSKSECMPTGSSCA